MRIHNSKRAKTYKVRIRLRVINNTVDFDKPGLVIVWIR